MPWPEQDVEWPPVPEHDQCWADVHEPGLSPWPCTEAGIGKLGLCADHVRELVPA